MAGVSNLVEPVFTTFPLLASVDLAEAPGAPTVDLATEVLALVSILVVVDVFAVTAEAAFVS